MITPLPKPLPVNLTTIKGLIDERDTEVDKIEKNIETERITVGTYREEISLLQNAAKELLKMNPKDKVVKENEKYDINGNIIDKPV